jgi:hypothetical protein
MKQDLNSAIHLLNGLSTWSSIHSSLNISGSLPSSAASDGCGTQLFLCVIFQDIFWHSFDLLQGRVECVNVVAFWERMDDVRNRPQVWSRKKWEGGGVVVNDEGAIRQLTDNDYIA